MWSRRSVLAGLAASALLPRSSSAQSPLSIQGTAAQAMPLFVSVRADAGEPCQVEWEGSRFELAWLPDRSLWRGVIPVSIDCPARPEGGLRVRQGDKLLAERNVVVKPRDYGIQYLTLPASTLAGYDNPRNKADDQAIQAVMRKLDSVQHWSGRFTSPCDAPESTGFGQRRLYNGWKKGWHKGLDLAGWEGQAVTAPAAGKVVHRARGIVNGNTLVLSHGLGVFSVYLHLNSFEVETGETVRSGQTIAAVGGTGGFAPHLHWEVRCYGQAVHPKAFYQLPADWV